MWLSCGDNGQLTKKIHNFLLALLSYQAPVVQTLDSTIHRVNHCPAKKYQGKQRCIIGWIEIYPVDNVIHLFNYWGYIGILRPKAKVTCWTFTSLLHSRFQCRHAMFLPTKGALHDDTKNGCVADQTFTCDLLNIKIFPVKVLLWMFTSCKVLQPFFAGTLLKPW